MLGLFTLNTFPQRQGRGCSRFFRNLKISVYGEEFPGVILNFNEKLAGFAHTVAKIFTQKYQDRNGIDTSLGGDNSLP